MAEPARKPDPAPYEPSVLLRHVRRPDGSVELLELPLTRELFLDPKIGDKMVQGFPHVRTVLHIFGLVTRHFEGESDTIVLSDVQHLMGRGKNPAPDLSVIRGLPDPDRSMKSYDFRRTGIAPSLILEVVSPDDVETRRTDEVDKVALYEKVGVPEYLLLYLPLQNRTQPYRLIGYRTGPDGRYRLVEPDSQGRFVSETTGLAFALTPPRDWIEIFDLATGRRLLTAAEEEEARKRAEEIARAAEEKATREAEARKAAEEELARLRAEIEALKRPGR